MCETTLIRLQANQISSCVAFKVYIFVYIYILVYMNAYCNQQMHRTDVDLLVDCVETCSASINWPVLFHRIATGF